MKFVFDLDGTLIDNRQAIVEAYRAVGVHEVPFSMPWHDFCSQAQHNAKARVYPEMLERYARPTQLFERLWTRWNADRDDWHRPRCLTGASSRAVDQITDLPWFRELRCVVDVTADMTPQLKADWLALHGWGTYVDDDADARRVIQELTVWKVIDPTEALSLL
jgi:phosphoglycolate phosphatase-like HAD superfamily hydrolase